MDFTLIGYVAVFALLCGLFFMLGAVAGEARALNHSDERVEKVRKAERERYERLHSTRHPDVESTRSWPTASFRRA